MNSLDEHRVAQLRERLLVKRAALLGLKVTAAEVGRVELDQSSVGRLARMDDLRAQAMSQESERRRNLELQQIDAALRRIEEGDYGYCLHCGEEIAAARLEFDPAAPLCIRCASAAETRAP